MNPVVFLVALFLNGHYVESDIAGQAKSMAACQRLGPNVLVTVAKDLKAGQELKGWCVDLEKSDIISVSSIKQP